MSFSIGCASNVQNEDESGLTPERSTDMGAFEAEEKSDDEALMSAPGPQAMGGTDVVAPEEEAPEPSVDEEDEEAGTDELSEEERRTTCGGILGNVNCTEDEYCALPEEALSCGSLGQCTERPVGCYRIYRPVCGCDGETYPNDCVARSNGTEVAFEGACEEEAEEEPGQADGEVCGGIRGLTCQEGSYCAFEAETCHIADRQGTCQPTPELCFAIYLPVCGCDGKTYGNACMAGVQGVSVDHAGACGSEVPEIVIIEREFDPEIIRVTPELTPVTYEAYEMLPTVVDIEMSMDPTLYDATVYAYDVRR